MSRSYNVIDADGHILEPFTLWDKYLDPKYRARAPKLVKDNEGKQKLLLEEKVLGKGAVVFAGPTATFRQQEAELKGRYLSV